MLNVDNNSNNDSFSTIILSKKNRELIMMKRLIMIILSGMCFGNGLQAMNSLQTPFVRIGQSIDNINLPLMGKLTNFLPFGLVATALKDYPLQSMMLVTGLLTYILSRNEKVRELFEKYKALGLAKLGIKQSFFDANDETLFIFDGEDADDAEEQMETEDELLDDSDSDDVRKKEEAKNPRILKFL